MVGTTAEAAARGMTTEEQLRFLVDTANDDPTALSPARWAVVLEDLRRFMWAGKIDDTDKDLQAALKGAAENRSKLAPVLQVIRTLVACTADRTKSEEINFKIEGTAILDATGLDKDGVSSMLWASDQIENIKLQVLRSLGTPEAIRVRRCERPSYGKKHAQPCRRFFFADRKGQRFCDKACANVGSLASRQSSQEGRADSPDPTRSQHQAPSLPTRTGPTVRKQKPKTRRSSTR